MILSENRLRQDSDHFGCVQYPIHTHITEKKEKGKQIKSYTSKNKESIVLSPEYQNKQKPRIRRRITCALSSRSEIGIHISNQINEFINKTHI